MPRSSPLLAGRQRILVIGSGGAGKSTFARALAEATGLPIVHLDRIFWRPGWVETPAEAWRERVQQLVDEPRWIIDGNYSGTLALRIAHADAIVFLDIPRLTCLRGVLVRAIRGRTRPRPDLAVGCDERIDLAFLRWVWRFRERSRPRIDAALAAAGADVEVIRVTTRAQAYRLLDALGSQGSLDPRSSHAPTRRP